MDSAGSHYSGARPKDLARRQPSNMSQVVDSSAGRQSTAGTLRGHSDTHARSQVEHPILQQDVRCRNGQLESRKNGTRGSQAPPRIVNPLEYCTDQGVSADIVPLGPLMGPRTTTGKVPPGSVLPHSSGSLPAHSEHQLQRTTQSSLENTCPEKEEGTTMVEPGLSRAAQRKRRSKIGSRVL